MTFRLPAWVKEADGRTVPFDADGISQRLFAATSLLHAPNSFLARELTDVVLHFLAQEELGDTTTWAALDEVVEKVVREVGHPELAGAYAEVAKPKETEPADDADRIPFDLPYGDAMRQVRAAYALETVFGPDLRSACEDGLIVLGGLQAPNRLAAQWIGEISGASDSPWEGGWRLVRDAAIGSGGRILLDRVEETWAGQPRQDLRNFLQGLRAGLEAADARVAICLHQWKTVSEPVLGSLFTAASQQTAVDHTAFYRLWFEEWDCASLGKRGVIYWGVQETTLAELPSAFGKRDDAADLAYVFDRPRRPTAPFEGLTLSAPAILLEAGLALDRFADMAGIDRDPAALLDKLGSLVRMAVSAAARKRASLRKTSELQRGFVLDRATLHLVPLGLDAAVRAMLVESPSRSPLSLDLACRIADRLREISQAESRKANLDIVLDSPSELVQNPSHLETPLRLHLEAWGQIHRRLGAGTAAIAESLLKQDSLQDLLGWIWRKTEVARLSIRRPSDVQTEFMA